MEMLLSKTDNIAIIVLALGCFGLGYLHVIWRREEREDRRLMVETIDSLREALHELRNALAAKTGKVF